MDTTASCGNWIDGISSCRSPVVASTPKNAATIVTSAISARLRRLNAAKSCTQPIIADRSDSDRSGLQRIAHPCTGLGTRDIVDSTSTAHEYSLDP